MPLDGIFLHQLTQELSAALVGGRVDRVHQPAREAVVLSMRSQGGTQKLLLSASAQAPRAHLTTLPQDNPMNPPMFCMLLRKHLSGAKLLEIRQQGLDRVLHLRFETTNELGDRVVLTLSMEIMGRHSNLILVDEHGRVIDAVKRITSEMSRVRPVLPGMPYAPVPAQPRLSILADPPSRILEALRAGPDGELSKALQQVLEGMSPLVCREIAHQVTRGAQVAVSQLDEELATRLRFFLSQLCDRLGEGRTQPTMLLDPQGRPKDFSYLEIHQYGASMACRPYPSYSQLLDQFYSERDRIDRVHQRGADLLKLLVNLTERTTRKLNAQQEELRQSENREQWKQMGDLLSANIYRLEKGMPAITVENYYAPGAPQLTIPLDPMLTPSKNIQRYYTRYRKADTAQRKLQELIAQGQAELDYFDTVLDELSRAGLESELAAIREELAAGGYVRKNLRGGRQEARKLTLLRYRSDDGFLILCGRNNLQNQRLTLHDSRNGDIWFHTQKIPGSHVVVVTQGQRPPDRTLEQAAVIAACNSKARESGKVAVDYTEIRNVRKHPSGRPGLVLYEPYQTAVVEPDKALAQRLLEK